MSEQVGDFALAILWVIVGSSILTNAEALARLDLGSSAKIRYSSGNRANLWPGALSKL